MLPKRLLVSNRGEIANRIFRTCKRLDIFSIALYTDNDIGSTHLKNADKAVKLTSKQGYMDIGEIISICKMNDVDAVHPGYGFLSENALFAEACERVGIAFLGPSSSTIETFGQKHLARVLARESSIPVIPGTDLITCVEEGINEANKIGYPVVIKAVAGGGGKGVDKCNSDSELKAQFPRSRRMAMKLFGDDRLIIEKLIQSAKHVEVQIFGNGKGDVIHMGIRDCSIQRRYQKIISETPALLPPDVEKLITESAVNLARKAKYNSAGTVEFMVDCNTYEFFFLEMNTRIQVEHTVTEMVYGIDIVEHMIRQGSATSENAFDLVQYQSLGFSIEVRLNAEDPSNSFSATSGKITGLKWPEAQEYHRLDTWVTIGTNIGMFFDPLVAKLAVWGPTRESAIERLHWYLSHTYIRGVTTNIYFLLHLLGVPNLSGVANTMYAESVVFKQPKGVTVIKPGFCTTIHDWPGRVSQNRDNDIWRIGIPPSGPYDFMSFRVANLLVGNDDRSPALEITNDGPTLLFNEACRVVVCGGECSVCLDNAPAPMRQVIHCSSGSVLRVGKITSGWRCYISFSGGGLDVPQYLGSVATFSMAKIGGLAGRSLNTYDLLHLRGNRDIWRASFSSKKDAVNLIRNLFDARLHIRVLPGPQEAPEYLTPADVDMFYSSKWLVHYNSNRLGIRFEGPTPKWTCQSGGAGGSHPSNLLDNEYTVGSINFTGDMPVAIGVDGPSLGGFVCNAVIASCDLWKLGQLTPGDEVEFIPISHQTALHEWEEQETILAGMTLRAFLPPRPLSKKFKDGAVLGVAYIQDDYLTNKQCRVTYRRQGDSNILVEFGEDILDLNYRFLAADLEKIIRTNPLVGIRETSPGVRSLQILYDMTNISIEDLVSYLQNAQTRLTSLRDMSFQSRILHLPIAFHDSLTKHAQEVYMKSVREKAPYLPNNLEFVRRNNGLQSVQDVKDVILSASYFVLGLGDVYLGAPCAVPLNPLHRLVNAKYNPARTYTPEGAVGLGGAFMCIYPMASPGGYQLVGRSLPIWNEFASHANFANGKPWLLRMFDQIKFFEVTEHELEVIYEPFRNGLHQIQIESDLFSVKQHFEFLRNIKDEEIKKFKQRQTQASEVELVKENEHWSMRAEKGHHRELHTRGINTSMMLVYVRAEFRANVWRIVVRPSDAVKKGDLLFVLEAMKMEHKVSAPCDARVVHVLKEQNDIVDRDEVVVYLTPTNVDANS